MGSPDFAVPSLEKLHNSSHDIITVLSGEDKRRSRRGKPVPTPVKKRAIDMDLKTLDTDNMRDPKLEQTLGELNPDLFVVVAFKILPKALLRIPAIGSINLHASLLPKYRGAAPIHWAIINGEKETGCSVFFLDENVDTGQIIKQRKTHIGPSETTGDLYNRLKLEGAALIEECVDLIAKGEVKTELQNNQQASPAPKLFRENTRVDFSKSAVEAHNLIRGLNPFPVAWCMYGDETMKLYRSKIGPDKNLKPGKLIFENNQLLTGTGKRTLELLEVQLPGRKKMSGVEFAHGFELDQTLQ
ncbi:methionyl-tRNA formyltransferase [soil metagenome]